jgi:hypothetical protein
VFSSYKEREGVKGGEKGYVEVAPAQIVYLDGASAKIGIFVEFGGMLDTHVTGLVPC